MEFKVRCYPKDHKGVKTCFSSDRNEWVVLVYICAMSVKVGVIDGQMSTRFSPLTSLPFLLPPSLHQCSGCCAVCRCLFTLVSISLFLMLSLFFSHSPTHTHSSVFFPPTPTATEWSSLPIRHVLFTGLSGLGTNSEKVFWSSAVTMLLLLSVPVVVCD